MDYGVVSCETLAALQQAGMLPYREEGYPCIERTQASANPDRATAETIRRMAELIRESIPTSRIQRNAARAVGEWRGGPAYAIGGPLYTGRFDMSDDRMISCSVWFFVKSALKFKEHAEQIKALLNEEDQLQLLIRPDVLLGRRRPMGDCAVYTPLVCALLGALNVGYEIVTVACDPTQPEVFSHVYARAVTRQGQRIPLDASHGKFPGWEVPREHQIRKQVWDENGQPIQDNSGQLRTLGAYKARRVWPRRIGMGRIGLGQTCISYDVEGNCQAVDTSGTAAIQLPAGSSLPTTGTFGPSVTATPTGPTFNWDAWLGNAINQGINLAGKVVAPTTTIVRGPNGQLMIQTPAGASTPAVLGGSLLSTGGGGNLLLLGGAAIVLVLVLGAMKK